MTIALARRMDRIESSAIREILKVAERPDVLSFAGGLPAPELFPIDALADAHPRVRSRGRRGTAVQQETEGYGPLRQWIAARLRIRRRRRCRTDTDRQLATGNRPHPARCSINPGDRIAVEAELPGAPHKAFGNYEARFAPSPATTAGWTSTR
ncbi:MAG: hypothetical protein U0470_02945 [Anaerolineae bacterium]